MATQDLQNSADVVDYRLYGDDMQLVEIELDAGDLIDNFM